MKDARLLILANLMAVFAVVLVWMDLSSTKTLLADSEAKLHHSSVLVGEIEQLRAEVADRVVIAEANYDPSVAVADAVKAAKLYRADFTTSETASRKIDRTDVRQCRVSLPGYQITMRQVLNLVSSLSDAEVNFQVATIYFERPKSGTEVSNNRGQELWDVSFSEVVYLKSDPGDK